MKVSVCECEYECASVAFLAIMQEASEFSTLLLTLWQHAYSQPAKNPIFALLQAHTLNTILVAPHCLPIPCCRHRSRCCIRIVLNIHFERKRCKTMRQMICDMAVKWQHQPNRCCHWVGAAGGMSDTVNIYILQSMQYCNIVKTPIDGPSKRPKLWKKCGGKPEKKRENRVTQYTIKTNT